MEEGRCMFLTECLLNLKWQHPINKSIAVACINFSCCHEISVTWGDGHGQHSVSSFSSRKSVANCTQPSFLAAMKLGAAHGELPSETSSTPISTKWLSSFLSTARCICGTSCACRAWCGLPPGFSCASALTSGHSPDMPENSIWCFSKVLWSLEHWSSVRWLWASETAPRFCFSCLESEMVWRCDSSPLMSQRTSSGSPIVSAKTACLSCSPETCRVHWNWNTIPQNGLHAENKINAMLCEVVSAKNKVTWSKFLRDWQMELSEFTFTWKFMQLVLLNSGFFCSIKVANCHLTSVQIKNPCSKEWGTAADFNDDWLGRWLPCSPKKCTLVRHGCSGWTRFEPGGASISQQLQHQLQTSSVAVRSGSSGGSAGSDRKISLGSSRFGSAAGSSGLSHSEWAIKPSFLFMQHPHGEKSIGGGNVSSSLSSRQMELAESSEEDLLIEASLGLGNETLSSLVDSSVLESVASVWDWLNLWKRGQWWQVPWTSLHLLMANWGVFWVRVRIASLSFAHNLQCFALNILTHVMGSPFQRMLTLMQMWFLTSSLGVPGGTLQMKWFAKESDFLLHVKSLLVSCTCCWMWVLMCCWVSPMCFLPITKHVAWCTMIKFLHFPRCGQPLLFLQLHGRLRKSWDTMLQSSLVFKSPWNSSLRFRKHLQDMETCNQLREGNLAQILAVILWIGALQKLENATSK